MPQKDTSVHPRERNVTAFWRSHPHSGVSSISGDNSHFNTFAWRFGHRALSSIPTQPASWAGEVSLIRDISRGGLPSGVQLCGINVLEHAREGGVRWTTAMMGLGRSQWVNPERWRIRYHWFRADRKRCAPDPPHSYFHFPTPSKFVRHQYPRKPQHCSLTQLARDSCSPLNQ